MDNQPETIPPEKELIAVSRNELLSYRSYIPSIFISAALPLRDVNKTIFDRKYNNITLHLTSPNKVPYGKYGRLLLSVLTTHAVQSKNSLNPDGTVTLRYDTLQSLLNEMQLPKQRSGEIKEQLNRFKSSTFIYEEEITKVAQKSLFPEYFDANDKGTVIAKKFSTGNMVFIDSMQYVQLDDGSSDKRSIAFTIVLNNKFVNLCKEHSVPIDYSVYKEISSALGKDLYAWLVYRNNGLSEDKPVFVPRDRLVEQFMPVSEESDPKIANVNYSRIIEQIKEIKEKYYPELKVNIDSGGTGITLYKSPTPVLQDDVRYALISSSIS